MEIDLKKYYHMLRKRIWLIVACMLLFTVPAALFAKDTYKPLYQASSEIMIGQAAYPQSIDYGSLGVIIKSPAVLDRVITNYPEVSMTASQLSRFIDVIKVNESQIMRIVVRNGSYEQAVVLANYVTQAAVSEIPKFMNTGVSVTVLSEAKLSETAAPINPKSNNRLKMTIISFIASVIIAVGLVLLLDLLDDTLKTEEDIRELFAVPTLAVVPKVKDHSIQARIRADQRVRTNAKEGASYATSNQYT